MQRGFTLIEVVISLVLFALISLALVSGMRTMSQTFTRTNDRVDTINDMRVISDFLRRTLGQPQLLRPSSKTEDGANPYFHGTSTDLYFVGNLTGYQGPGGLQLIHLYLAGEGDGGKRLMMQMRPWQEKPDWTPDWSAAKPQFLIGNVTHFALSYLAPGDKQDWREQWSYPRSYPRAIRLTMAVHGRYWPELVLWIGGGDGS